MIRDGLVAQAATLYARRASLQRQLQSVDGELGSLVSEFADDETAAYLKRTAAVDEAEAEKDARENRAELRRRAKGRTIVFEGKQVVSILPAEEEPTDAYERAQLRLGMGPSSTVLQHALATCCSVCGKPLKDRERSKQNPGMHRKCQPRPLR